VNIAFVLLILGSDRYLICRRKTSLGISHAGDAATASFSTTTTASLSLCAQWPLVPVTSKAAQRNIKPGRQTALATNIHLIHFSFQTESISLNSIIELHAGLSLPIGPQQGREVMTLQTLADYGDEQFTTRVANVAGFSMHAGVATGANERDKLERLCRYITRSAVSTKRLSMTRNGRVRYELKTPWRNGTTHVIFEPLDFISRLVSLIPKPRVNLTRFHGVFAPNSKYRAKVTPTSRGKRKKSYSADEAGQSAAEKRAAMTWARRLKRVFNIDITTCDNCGADVRIIASIEDTAVIQKILAHLDTTASSAATAILPDCRASPSLPLGLFD